MAGISVVAAVGLWEFVKKLIKSLSSWWSARSRRLERAERLRTRTRDAVQEELRRREVELTENSGLLVNRVSRRASSTTSTTTTRASSSWTSTKDVGIQTVSEPVIPLERLRTYTGPFFTTPHGDRIHTAQYCHGQRNATRPPKRYDLCAYCQNTHSLYVINPDMG